MRVPAQVLLLLLLLPCPAAADEAVTWGEEAVLGDGRVVIVHRRTTLADVFPLGRRGKIMREEFCYKPMKAYWSSKHFRAPADVQLIGNRLMLMLLLKGCSDCKTAGLPDDSALYL